MIRNSVILATLVSTFTFAQQGPDRRNNSNMVQDAGGQVFNVRAYGAKIDGTTDDSPAVQSAIKAASSVGGGEVLIPSGIVALDSRVNMAANVSVHCSARGTILLFRQPTDGIVWPSTATRSALRGCVLRAGNASSGKAIDIEDQASAASNVVIEDVKIDALTPPTNLWAYGVYLSNALLDRFSRIEFQSATIYIHTEGFSNSNDFDSVNITGNVASTTYVDIQGGSPITFLGGEIEGAASGELMKITQPGSAATYINILGTTFENASPHGIGVHANGGRFEAHAAGFSTAGSKGFVVGDASTTQYCKVFGGSGASWTLGANASFTTIDGYIWSGLAPIDNSAGVNTILDVRYAGDTSVTSPSIPYGPVFNAGNQSSAPVPRFKKGFTIDPGAAAQFGSSGYDIYVISDQLKFRQNGVPMIILDHGTGATGIRRLSGGGMGSPLSSSNFSLSPGWGSDASVSSVSGTDQRFTITVTSCGTGQAANPTITLTFADGTWSAAPFAIVTMNGGTGRSLEPGWSSTPTTMTFTYPGTPVSRSTYAFAVFVIG